MRIKNDMVSDEYTMNFSIVDLRKIISVFKGL